MRSRSDPRSARTPDGARTWRRLAVRAQRYLASGGEANAHVPSIHSARAASVAGTAPVPTACPWEHERTRGQASAGWTKRAGSRIHTTGGNSQRPRGVDDRQRETAPGELTGDPGASSRLTAPGGNTAMLEPGIPSEPSSRVDDRYPPPSFPFRASFEESASLQRGIGMEQERSSSASSHPWWPRSEGSRRAAATDQDKKKARSVSCGPWKNPAITYFRA